MSSTKREMIERIAERVGVTGEQAREIVQATLDNMIETLSTTGRIELRNFGVFVVKRVAPRNARNPRTGESVMVSAHNVVRFKAGKVMDAAIQNDSLQPA
jgi:integration host factor subunit beta